MESKNEWRSIRELKSNLRGMWDEISKLTDWTWKNEQRLDEIEKRLKDAEERQNRLHRSKLTFHPKDDKSKDL